MFILISYDDYFLVGSIFKKFQTRKSLDYEL